MRYTLNLDFPWIFFYFIVLYQSLFKGLNQWLFIEHGDMEVTDENADLPDIEWRQSIIRIRIRIELKLELASELE